MPTVDDLSPLISDPREDLSTEYKQWLDLSESEHKATLAKAAIAIANHGGGFIVIGFSDDNQQLQSETKPENIAEIDQDTVNSAVRRFATPEFHCSVYFITHNETNVEHPIISVPGNLTVPVMCKRDCDGVVAKYRCYIRKPGPRSEEPHNGEEWQTLLQRCLRAGREDMLEAIRSIVSGRAQSENPRPDALAQLEAYCLSSRTRWAAITEELPQDSPPRFPSGYYEMGFSIVGGTAATDLVDLQDRLAYARRIKHTGWTPFLDMHTPAWAPYPADDCIEAWVGRPNAENWVERDASRCDFWRASKNGSLYTIRGYSEDGIENRPPGQLIDLVLPVWRVGEGLLFAARFADRFPDAEDIAIWYRFTGLNDRCLTSVQGNRAIFDDRISRTNDVQNGTQVTIAQALDNTAEVVHSLLVPLYEKFDFFDLPFVLVEEELERLRSGNF